MKTISKITVLLLSTALLSSCANKQAIGTGAGAIVGGLLGSQFGKGSGQIAATVIGAGAGALIGGEIGRRLDEKDKQLLSKASQQALEKAPSGQQIEWKNPDSGHYGYVTPTKTYQSSTGQYCREYVQKAIIGGEEQKIYGKACRKGDGQWEIVNN